MYWYSSARKQDIFKPLRAGEQTFKSLVSPGADMYASENVLWVVVDLVASGHTGRN